MNVKVGQIWVDGDPRMKGRQIIVVQVNAFAAVVMNTITGKRTRIDLKRFHPGKRGYRLIYDTNELEETECLK